MSLYACLETLETIIIEPCDGAEHILHNIHKYQLTRKYIIKIHGHIDHNCAIDAISAFYHVLLAIHASTGVNANGQIAHARFW